MKRLIFSLAGIVAISMLSVGACGGSSDSSSAADASSDVLKRFEVAPFDDDTFVPYTKQTTTCVPAPYTNQVVDPDASFAGDDAGDDDAGPSLGPPQAASSGGPVLANPQIIPMTYPGDALADPIEDFASSVGCTDYWRQTVSEYGVGQAKMATPVHLTTPPPTTITDSAIRTLIQAGLVAGTPGFANLPPDVIFTLFLPSGSNFELQGSTSCGSGGIGGYHDSLSVTGITYAYAVVARCNGDNIDDVTGFASHEIAEASTDPHPGKTDSAYYQPDNAHVAFGISGGEVGDLCENNSDAFFTPSGYPFSVQRTWSNASILEGHDPCVPAEPGPYVAAIPDQPDSVAVQNQFSAGSAGGTTIQTRGIAIAVGDTRTIDIHFHSDDPATTTWAFEVFDSSRFIDGMSHLTLTLDTKTATVGQVAHLTITRMSKSTVYGAETFALSSTKGGNNATWFGMVGDPQ